MIAIIRCDADAGVVPYGGVKHMLGTNPLAIALPAGKHVPVCLAMATSMAAQGKNDLAQKEGRSIPDTWGVGPDGARTTDPHVALAGALLPFAGYKGYGIGLIIDMFWACLAGSSDSRHTNSFCHDFENHQNLGYSMILIDVEKIAPLAVFGQRMDQIIEEFQAVPTAPGVESVLMPGQIEDEKERISLAEGIALSDALVAELRQVGARYGVEFPF